MPHPFARPAALFCLVGLTAALAACAGGPPAADAPGRVASAAPRPDAPMSILEANEWELVAMSDAHGNSDTRWRLRGQSAPRLVFAEGRASLRNLCNVISAGYAVQGSTLQMQPGVSTKRACPGSGLMELEQRMASQLAGALNYEVRNNAGGPPLLVLYFGDGSRWELKGSPTSEARYGGAGERVFLEVAPDRVACNHPLMRNAQCLNVRELRYADDGVRQGAGPWQPLYGDIEGYTHEPGMRNILRLKRFQRAEPRPADVPAKVYVLDMVVETERVR